MSRKVLAAVGITGAVLWGFWVLPFLGSALPENDLWWMFPTMEHYLKGQSVWGAMAFLLGPLPVGFAQPILKLYLLAVSRLLGPEVQWLILGSVLIHFANAWLLAMLARQWGLSARVAAAAGAVYLCFFGHFHAVLWPTASQHLITLTTVLGLLILYFRAEERMGQDRPAGWLLAGAAAVTAFASFQRSAFIALALMGAHLLWFSRDAEERTARFRRWAGFFAIYSIYPVVTVTSTGDPVVTEGLRKLSIPEWMRTLLVTDPLVPNPIPWPLRAAALFGLLAAGLGAILAVLRIPAGKQWEIGRRGRRWAAAVGLAVVLLWCLKDKRQVLFLYNMSVPFLASFSMLLDPIRAALSMDSTEPYYYLGPQVSAGTLLLALGTVWLFWKAHASRNRTSLLLLIWYLVTLGVALHQNTSLPLRMPSRYFIYISPILAIVVAAAGDALFGRFFPERSVGVRGRLILAWALFLALGSANLAAVRVAMYRGRMANAFLFYDDLRTLRLIGERETRGPAVVRGVTPMPIREQWRDFPLEVPADYDNLRVAAEALGAGSYRSERAMEGALAYTLNGTRVLNPLGLPVEPFDQLMEGTSSEIRRGLVEEGVKTLEEALERPVFLVKHLEGSGRFSDIRWATGGLDITDWMSRMEAAQSERGQPQPPKLVRVEELWRAEVEQYEQALFLLAYLHHRAGRNAESQYFFSQIQLLDRDPEAIVHAVNNLPSAIRTPELEAFLVRSFDPAFSLEAINWKKEDYAFLRFLLRLILGVDVRSEWDRRFSPVL